MSALGHYLEEEGIATVPISLIRPQTENTKPPHALRVPFELGRPFGPPSDPAFQKRVILAALRLLEREDGPVLIEDFPDDNPRAQPDPAWHAPFTPASIGAGDTHSLAARLEAELLLLQGAHQRWVREYQRSTVSLSGFSIAEAGHYVADWLRGEAPASPREGFSAPLLLRVCGRSRKGLLPRSGRGWSRQTVKPSAWRLVLERYRHRRCASRATCVASDQRGRAAEIDRRQFHGARRAGT